MIFSAASQLRVVCLNVQVSTVKGTDFRRSGDSGKGERNTNIIKITLAFCNLNISSSGVSRSRAGSEFVKCRLCRDLKNGLFENVKSHLFIRQTVNVSLQEQKTSLRTDSLPSICEILLYSKSTAAVTLFM